MESNEKQSLNKKTDTMTIATAFPGEVYRQIIRFQLDNGFNYPQEAIRLIVANGLKNSGYLREDHPAK